MGPINLSGKGAIVTGGGSGRSDTNPFFAQQTLVTWKTLSGICFEFVKQLFEAGCNVLICDLRLVGPAEEWVRSATGKTPSARVRFLQTDVTDWGQLKFAFTVFEREFGRVPDILCPGAGVYDPVCALPVSNVVPVLTVISVRRKLLERPRQRSLHGS
jgi:NAD(P)-dependent dehydrogenase (short-subunit alcohol dehydrogenase family)